jgi:hypothetical protein
MDLILLSITIGFIVYSSWLYIKYSDCRKRGIEYTKEYKHLKEDYFELMREFRDLKNKNVLLESVIKQIKK